VSGVGLALPVLLMASDARAASETFCQQYAKSAVQQYQQMSKTAACHVPDDLRWQANLDNHFAACRKLPEFLMRSEQSARDNHLAACGGKSDVAASTPAGDASAVGASAAEAGAAAGEGGASATAAASATSAQGAAPAAKRPAPLARQKVAVGACQIPAALELRLNKNDVGSGSLVQFSNGTLTYHSSGNAYASKNAQAEIQTMESGFTQDAPLVTTPVARPKFFATNCRGFPADTAGGPWVASGGAGQTPRFLSVDGNGLIIWRGVSAELSQELLTGIKAPAATAAPAAKPAKATH
jgi:hypothetical protein